VHNSGLLIPNIDKTSLHGGDAQEKDDFPRNDNLEKPWVSKLQGKKKGWVLLGRSGQMGLISLATQRNVGDQAKGDLVRNKVLKKGG